jgi:glucose/arabinose dehydrogenase
MSQNRKSLTIISIAVVVLVLSAVVIVLIGAQTPVQNPRLNDQTPPDRNVTLRLVADGLTHPVRAISPPDGSNRLFIVDQIGTVWIMGSNGTLLSEPFINISTKLVPLSPSYDERGLLGLAFHPSYATNGKFYLWYSAPLDAMAPARWDHTNILGEFKTTSDQNIADPSSERIILKSNNPYSNHNGGDINFGPDGYLYLPLGDGGGGNDVGMGHSDIGNGQDLSNVLGKVLRIDIDKNSTVNATQTIDLPGGNIAFGIPADNPFVSGPGRDEIYAYGLRNPAFATFDPGGNHSYFVGNAGQDLYEGAFLVGKGSNCGWPIMENGHCFDRSNSKNLAAGCVRTTGYLGEPLVRPIFSLPHSEFPSGSITVIGGYVYRGSAIPQFQGGYLSGIWLVNSLISISLQNGSDWTYSPLIFTSFQDRNGVQIPGITVPSNDLSSYLMGFGLGSDKELYVLTTENPGPSGSTGKVWKILPG